MTDDCCNSACPSTALNDPKWRTALWIALVINAAMFTAEMVAGAAADSRALMADALDFLGDAGNYAISLIVAGMALTVRAKAALFKGATLFALGAFILAGSVYAALTGTSPQPATMGIVGGLALAANAGVALMLYRFRTGDANMRSVWICSRNDAIGNLAVVAAAAGVFGTGSHWPDLVVAAILASLGVSGGVQIVRHAKAELRGERAARIPAA